MRTDIQLKDCRRRCVGAALFACLTLMAFVASAESSESPAVSLQSLVESGVAVPFPFREHSNFSFIAVVPMRNPEFIYVAVPNHIIKVGLRTMEVEDTIEWSSKREDTVLRNCQLHGVAKDKCPENRIFALQATNDFKLLVCGSVMATPICSLRSAMQPKTSFGSYTIQLQDSDLQSEKVIAMEDKQIFVGAFLRPGRADPAIFRSSLVPSGDAIRTNQDMQLSRGMKSIYKPAKFISVHIVGDYVYYFFQENYEEMGTCGTKAERTISRVARVCKSDPGYQRLWLSYAKSRLVCSEGGNWARPMLTDAWRDHEPFFYDLLQDTYVTDTHIYGVFTASRHGVRASAICGFPLSTFNQVFGDASVKVKRWESRESGAPISYFVEAKDQFNRSDCSSLHLHKNEMGEYERMNWQFFLKSQWTVPDTNQPVAATANENWLRLIVERLPGSQAGQWHTVAYVLTEHRSIKKILLAEGNRCVLDEITLDPSLDGQINDMKLLPGGRLLISTNARLVQLPTSRCHLLASREACLAARDPHCGWNSPAAACTVRPENTKQWHQEVSAAAGRICPRRPLDADEEAAAWSDWSPWRPCQSTAGPATPACQCRVRLAGLGSWETRRLQQVLSNCSRDGGWSGWTEWGPCGSDVSDGDVCVGQQTRRRRCDSPKPAFGGANCGGLRDATGGTDKQAEARTCVPTGCQKSPDCGRGQWGSWSEWSSCDRYCGSGSQNRSRVCSVLGGVAGVTTAQCAGDSRQWRRCNEQACSEIASHAPTSDWIRRADWPAEASSSGPRNGRSAWIAFGAVCRLSGSVEAPQRLEVTLTNFSRFCDAAGGNCRLAATPTPHWSSWSCWSECTQHSTAAAACGGVGSQMRSRVCIDDDGGSGGCGGSAIQHRDCQLSSCAVYSDWSPWSNCGLDSQNTRTRACKRAAAGCLGAKDFGSLSQMQSLPCGQPQHQPGIDIVDRRTPKKIMDQSSTSEEGGDGSGRLSYPMVAVVCLTAVLVACLVGGAVAFCLQRRQLVGMRRQVRKLQDQLRDLGSGQQSANGSGGGVAKNGISGKPNLHGCPTDPRIGGSCMSDSLANCSNVPSLMTSLDASCAENCFKKLSASANAGGNQSGCHPGPPPPPRYQRSTSATEPRLPNPLPGPLLQMPLPPALPARPVAELTASYNQQDAYSSWGAGSSRGFFDVIRYLKPQQSMQEPQPQELQQQQSNYYQHYPSQLQPRSPGPYSLADADDSTINESNPLLMSTNVGGAQSTLPGRRGAGHQRRVSSSSQTDSSSLRRTTRAATCAPPPAAGPVAVKRQQSEPAGELAITEFSSPV